MGGRALSELAVAATVGTASRRVDLAMLPEPVRLALEPIGDSADPAGGADAAVDSNPTASLLDAAALLVAAGRASAPLVASHERPTSPPPDARPEPGHGYAAPMGQLLSRASGRSSGQGRAGERSAGALPLGPVSDAVVLEAVVLDALAELHRAGYRLPTTLLVPLLDWARDEFVQLRGRQHADRAAALLPVLGERGRWLAGLDPLWAAMITQQGRQRGDAADDPFAAAAVQQWQHGSTDERLDWFAWARSVDPDRAREVVADGFAGEPVAVRAGLVSALGADLVPGDEELLEAALDDRSKLLPAPAQRLLRRLPGSAYAERAAARVEARIRKRIVGWKFSGTDEGGPLTESDLRDLGLGAARTSGSETEHLVAAVPTSAWGDRLPLTVDQAYRALRSRPVRTGLIRAVHADRSAEAAEQILSGDDAGADEVVHLLLEVLPVEALANALQSRLEHLTAAQLTTLLQRVPSPWPDALTITVLEVAADASPLRVHKTVRAETRRELLFLLQRHCRVHGQGPAASMGSDDRTRTVDQTADQRREPVALVSEVAAQITEQAVRRAAHQAARTLALRTALQRNLRGAESHGHQCGSHGSGPCRTDTGQTDPDLTNADLTDPNLNDADLPTQERN